MKWMMTVIVAYVSVYTLIFAYAPDPREPRVLADCEQTTVQNAINAASNGDTITMPSGTCTWTNIVTIPDSKGIALAGSGQAATIIKRSGIARHMNVDTATGNSLTRITAMTLDLDYQSGTAIEVYGEGVDRFRIDNVTFEDIGGNGIVVVSGPGDSTTGVEFTGLIDNNTFQCGAADCGGTHAMVIYGSPVYGESGWGAPFGRAVGFGANTRVYIEDNTFTFASANDGCIDTYGGAKFAWRFNTQSGCQVSAHGADSADYRGIHSFEVYSNNVTLSAMALVFFRAGSGFIFNNTWTVSGSPMNYAFAIYRVGSDWGLLNVCDGTQPWDGNAGGGDKPGWPCLDQGGYIFDADGGAGYASYPIYIFSDRQNGTLPTWTGQGAYQIADREVYSEEASFTGATGVGVGVLASRPATCTTGVGYWATDQGSWNAAGADGVFYKCTATDTWTLHYTPYTYPHPLRGGAPTAPTNVRIR